jgi:hypothetical protein
MGACDWNRANLDLFVDRDFLAKRILVGLKSAESFCVLGGRKSGKTMLLKRIKSECRAPFIAAYVDFQMAPPGLDLRWVFEELVRTAGLVGEWQGDFVKSVEVVVAPLREKGQFLVAILDEIESLDGCSWAGAFFDNLNHLLFTNDRTSRGLSLVLSGGTFLDGSPKLSPCSPLLIRLSLMPLKLFNLEETEELCRLVAGDKVPQGLAGRLHEVTAGHPALLQYHLGKLEDSEWKEDIHNSEVALKRDSSKLCESVFRHTTEHDLQVYLELDRGELSLPSSSSKLRAVRDSLTRLSYLGLIGRTNDALGRRGPKMFRAWFNEWLGPKVVRDPIAALESDKEESHFLEYKSTFAVDLFRSLSRNETVRSSEVVAEVPQAIVGFLNADGGDIIVGICEPKDERSRQALSKFPSLASKKIIGLKLDFELLKGGWDEVINALLSHLKEKTDPTVAALLGFEQHIKNDSPIAVIRVPKGKKYYYYDQKFLLRVQNRTQTLSTEESIDYQRNNPR